MEDPDWEIAMVVSVKYIAKIMNKMQCGKAMADGGFGVPPEEHFVFGAFDKLYTGEWEWNAHQAIHTQLVKIARATSTIIWTVGRRKNTWNWLRLTRGWQTG